MKIGIKTLREHASTVYSANNNVLLLTWMLCSTHVIPDCSPVLLVPNRPDWRREMIQGGDKAKESVALEERERERKRESFLAPLPPISTTTTMMFYALNSPSRPPVPAFYRSPNLSILDCHCCRSRHDHSRIKYTENYRKTSPKTQAITADDRERNGKEDDFP